MSEGAKRGAKFPLRLDDLPRRKHATPQGDGTAEPGALIPPKPAPVGVTKPAVLRPQRLLEQAHAQARSKPLARSATGAGLDSADVRKRMVMRLRSVGVRDEMVLQAMGSVPRHRFVDAALVAQAYEDTSLPIGYGQTISKPSVVARMIELLMAGALARKSSSLGRVLEIGTGCGYQAAVLSSLARHAVSVERIKLLHDRARELLSPVRPPNLRLVYGDGMRGHPPNAPYDSIITAACGDVLAAAWLEQLSVGGRLVSPQRLPGSERQVLMVVDRTEKGFEQNAFDEVHFVPLKSGLVE